MACWMFSVVNVRLRSVLLPLPPSPISATCTWLSDVAPVLVSFMSGTRLACSVEGMLRTPVLVMSMLCKSITASCGDRASSSSGKCDTPLLPRKSITRTSSSTCGQKRTKQQYVTVCICVRVPAFLSLCFDRSLPLSLRFLPLLFRALSPSVCEFACVSLLTHLAGD